MSFSEPCALAVDFGGTSIKMGVTAGERILATADRIPTAMFESPQAIIDAMIASARTLRGQFPSACVMGMGMPGGLIPAGGRNTCAVGTSATAAGSSGYARTSRP